MVELRIDGRHEAVTHEEWELRVREGRVPGDAMVRMGSITGADYVRADSLGSWSALRDEADRKTRSSTPTAPLVTAILVGFQIRLWTWAHVGEVQSFLSEHFLLFSPSLFENGAVWRAFTMGLLQFDLLHAFMNLLWSFFLGWILEATLGRVQLLVLFTAAVSVGSAFSVFASPWTPSLGSSGGVFGLVGATVTFGIVRSELVASRLGAAVGVFMLPYLILTFSSGLSSEGVDNWCHLGGMVTGLALGLVLDPPHAQRRRHWNAAVWSVLATTMVGGWLTVALFGPRLLPLWADDDARYELKKRASRTPVEPPAHDTYRALTFGVPGGWREVRDLLGRPAFRSPVGDRVFGVRAEPHDRPQVADEVFAEVRARITTDWPQASFDDPVPTTLSGREASLLRGSTGGDDPQTFEVMLATRGVWTLTVFWQVEPGWAGRLGPLRDRLVDAVVWRDPEELENARIADTTRSTRETRRLLASALAAVGERAEVERLHAGLLVDPDDDTWRSCLSDLVVLGADADVIRATVARMLATEPDRKLVVVGADALETAGASETARGLLLVGWDRFPGDRALRRARRTRNLSVALLPDGRPWDRVYDPRTYRERDAADQEARATRGLDLETADLAAREWAQERVGVAQNLRAHLVARDPAVLRDLAVLAQGDDTLEPADRASLVDAALAEVSPDWLPGELAPELKAAEPFLRSLL